VDEIGEWEKDVPADLRPAIAHLRKSFDEAHFACGEATRRFCYATLHGVAADDPTMEYFRYLMAMRRSVSPLRSQHFDELLNSKALPSVFKAYFDLYVDAMSAQTLDVLRELIAIGRANEEQLGGSAFAWAEAQAKHLISSHRREIKNWVQDVCDRQVHSPGDDPEETVFWRSWQAPSLILMTPCGRLPYEAEKVWQRYPPETSARWLEIYANQYVLNLEDKVEKLIGRALLESAKQTPVRSPSSAQMSSPTPRHAESPVRVSPPAQPSTNTIRREARKLETQAKYRLWQTAYRRLKKKRPDQSDVWFSQQIAKMSIAGGSTAETIRKRMRQK
jgi:hypothetical protein